MNVVTLYTVLPEVGGSATITLGLAEFYLREGLRVNILVRRQPGYDYNRELAAQLRRLGAKVILVGSPNGNDRWAPLAAICAAWRTRRGALISIGMGKGAALLAKWGGFEKRFFYYINHDPDVSPVRNLGKAVQDFDAIVAISPTSLESLSALPTPPRETIWIPQFSELRMPVSAGRKPSFESAPSFGFIGALKESKGINLLLDIWRRNPALGALHVLGDGPLRPTVEAAATNDPRIQYGGRFSSEERDRILPEFFGSVDWLLVPSIGHGEGIPTVILEAMSCGCPVIASNGGGTRAFAEQPLASAFAEIVNVIPEASWERGLSELSHRPAPNEHFRQEVIDRYKAWFSDSVLGPKWKALLK
ncbi:MAG TPA: glycosyltransferase [Chthoniobacterales bacterium]